MTRAPKAVWSEYDTELLKWAVSRYHYRQVNYTAIARIFPDHTAMDIKRRCAVLRDRARRLERWRALCVLLEPCDDPPSPDSVLEIPRAAQLHPAPRSGLKRNFD